MKQTLTTLFRGIGQIMLQKNAFTGFFFLLGLFFASLYVGIGAIIAVIIATISAYLLKYKKQDILDGQYGFNATLIGILVFTLYKVSVLSTSILIIGVLISVLIMNFMHTRKLNPLTAPFVISGWIVIAIMTFLKTPTIISTFPPVSSINILTALTFGFSQVMLQGNLITGILFYIGLLANGLTIGTYSLFGSVSGMLTAMILAFPITLTHHGIYGYNAVLCAIALSGKKLNNLVFALIAIILSVIITYLFGLTFIPALTAPFVLATWITLGLKKFINKH